MASGLTTALLLAAVRRRTKSSSATAAGTADADLIEYADAETLSRIVPMLVEVQEDHMVTFADTALASGTTVYKIPYRAIGGKVREVARVSSTGVVSLLARTPLEEMGEGSGDYYIRGNDIVLNVDPGTTTDSLRVYYQIRPSQLVASSAVAVVSAINTGTKTITTTATVPSTMTTGVTFDLVRAKPGFECLGIDLTASVCSGTTWTGAATLPTSLAVGDYLCLSEQTTIVQLPVEIQPILTQRVAIKVLEAKGMTEGLSNAREQLSEMERRAMFLLTPRVDSSPTKIVGHNPLFGYSPIPGGYPRDRS